MHVAIGMLARPRMIERRMVRHEVEEQAHAASVQLRRATSSAVPAAHPRIGLVGTGCSTGDPTTSDARPSRKHAIVFVVERAIVPRASSRPSGLRFHTPIMNTCVNPRAAMTIPLASWTQWRASRDDSLERDSRSSHGHALISNRCGWFIAAASFQPPVVSLAGSWKLVAGSW